MWLVVASACALALLSGCGADARVPTTRFSVPTLARPTIAVPSVTTVTAGPQRSASPEVDLRSGYPLRLADAQGYVRAGHAVAGWFPAGELRVQKLDSTEWVTKPVTEEVCKDRWDPLTGKYKYSCKMETVYKRVAERRTKFWVSGPGVSTVAYETVNQAFAHLAPTDYWRTFN